MLWAFSINTNIIQQFYFLFIYFNFNATRRIFFRKKKILKMATETPAWCGAMWMFAIFPLATSKIEP
jgi:hypothetical protein